MIQDAQPFVLAGSGTLGWEVVASNLLRPSDEALVISCGVFGTWFADCLSLYGKTTVISCPFGTQPATAPIINALMSKPRLVTITHVDTSTGVLADLNALCKLIQLHSPESLIVVDAVCSALCEEIRMQEFGIDCILTASQKALGVPPGLCVLLFSQRAMSSVNPRGYYTSINKWLPIMQNYQNLKPSYFATPPVQLILALAVSLELIEEQGLEKRFALHKQASKIIKDHCILLGLDQAYCM